MNPEVEIELIELEKQEQRIYLLAKEMNQDLMFHLDFLANAVLDRSLHLIFGFTTLIRQKNFIGAAHLVRCHLDNVLRFSAAWLVDNPHDFAFQIMSGKHISNMRDSNGNKMSDLYLRNKLNEQYPWINSVYKETSGFIHLSRKHIMTSSKLSEKSEGRIEFRISKQDNFVSDENRIESIQCMDEVTNILLKYIEGWIWTKKNPGKAPQ